MAIIDPYVPAVPPRSISTEAQAYLDSELRRLADILNQGPLYAVPLAAEPAKPQDGVIVYADGTNWDPGSGLGFYGYENGSWVKL